MKSLLAACLVLSSCIAGTSWRHEPMWSVFANETEGMAFEGSTYQDGIPSTVEDYRGYGVMIGGNIRGQTTFGDVEREILRGLAVRGGGVTVMDRSTDRAKEERIRALSERVATLDKELAAERATHEGHHTKNEDDTGDEWYHFGWIILVPWWGWIGVCLALLSAYPVVRAWKKK